MGLRRYYDPSVGVFEGGTPDDYHLAADVHALLASIREAVAAEREQVAGAIHVYPDSPIDRARAALDALLNEAV